MSELTLKLIILLIPGAIATIIYGKLILHKEWNNFKYLLLSTLFGVFSYLIVQLFIVFKNSTHLFQVANLSIWNSVANSKIIPWDEVIYATITGVLLSFFVVLIENKKLVFCIAKWLGVSNKYGDENLYSRFLNKDTTSAVYVRNAAKGLTYLGYVSSFSENNDVCEIELNNVIVYSYEDSDKLYEIDRIFLSFDRKEIVIEYAIDNN